MTSKEIYQSIDQSKISPKGKDFLQKAEKSTKGFTIQNDKLDSVMKKLYADLKAKKPEALKDVKTKTVETEVKVPTTKAEQKKEPKKKTKTVKKKVKKATGKKKNTKPTKTPSEPKEGKKEHISTRAKKLANKEGISFKEARARLSKEAKEQVKKDEKEANKELEKLLKFVRKESFEDGEKYPKIYGKQDPEKASLSADAKRKAKPIGKRISKDGNTYYEYRDNRSDRNSLPTKEGYKYKGKTPPYLEAGGTLPTPFGQAGLVGETGAMNEVDLFAMGGGLPQGVHQYYANTYNPAYPTPHGYAKGGQTKDVIIEQTVYAQNGNTYTLDEYQKLPNEKLMDRKPLALSVAKAKLLEYNQEAKDYEDEIMDIKDVDELADFVRENNLGTAENTYNYSWWGGVRLYVVVHNDGDRVDLYDDTLIFMSYHRGGDVRGNYEKYEAFDMQGYLYEEFPPLADRMRVRVEKDGKSIIAETEDSEGYDLYIIESDFDKFKEGDTTNLDDLGDEFGFEAYKYYKKGGKIKSKNYIVELRYIGLPINESMIGKPVMSEETLDRLEDEFKYDITFTPIDETKMKPLSYKDSRKFILDFDRNFKGGLLKARGYAKGGKIGVGSVVANKKYKTIGIVRDYYEKNGDARTDADGMVNISDLEAYNPKKHKNYKIAPSTKDEIKSAVMDYAKGGKLGKESLKKELDKKLSSIQRELIESEKDHRAEAKEHATQNDEIHQIREGIKQLEKGGMMQGYNDRLDESLGNRDGVEPMMMQSYKDRRDESKGMEKAMGRRAYQSVGTMDKMAKGGMITSAPEYHKVRNAEYDRRVKSGKIKDTDDNFERFDEMYFDELVKKGRIDPNNYFAKGGNVPKVDEIYKRTYYWVADDKDGNILAMGDTKSEVMKQLKSMNKEGVIRMQKGGEIDAFIMKFIKDAPSSNLKVDAEELTAKLKKGGKLGFEGLAKKVAKRYEGKPVKRQFQNEYGKTYSKAEAMEVGRKVAGKVYREQQAMAKGGYIPYEDVREFEVYVSEFYGKDGIYKDDYDGGFTKQEIIEAVSDYIKDPKTEWGGGDSLDRELMRDRYLIPSRYPNRRTEFKEAGGTLPTPFGQAGLVGETGTLNEMELFAMGGGLPQGVHQYYANTYNPAYPTPHGYAKGGEVYDLRDRLIDLGDEDFVEYEERQSSDNNSLYSTFKERLEDYHDETVFAKGGDLKEFEKGKFLKGKQWNIYKGGSGKFLLEKYKGGDLVEMYVLDVEEKGLAKAENEAGYEFDDDEIQEYENDPIFEIVYEPEYGGDILVPEDVQLKVISIFRKAYPNYNFGDEYENQIRVNQYSTLYAKGGDVKELRKISKELGKSVKAHDRQSKELKKIASSLVEEGKMAKGGEIDSAYVDELRFGTGMSKDAIEELIERNNFSKDNVLNLIVGLGRGLIKPSLVSSAYFGGKTSKENKKLVEFSKSNKAFKMAKGGRTQGYNDKLDESLGNTKGKRSTKEQNYKDRRNESEAMEKKGGKRKYARVKTMDKGNRKKKMKTPMTLAKAIRREGEKWQDAVKRASAMIRKDS